jgi:phosphoribosylformylglycinamidine synthase
LKGLPESIYLPVAHAEGKFFCDLEILDKIKKNNQVALSYSSNLAKDVGYPDNPNGSLDNIAGIVDETGRVFGLMPHPERYIFAHQHPDWQRRDLTAYGLSFFHNSVDYFK